MGQTGIDLGGGLLALLAVRERLTRLLRHTRHVTRRGLLEHGLCTKIEELDAPSFNSHESI